MESLQRITHISLTSLQDNVPIVIPYNTITYLLETKKSLLSFTLFNQLEFINQSINY